MRLGVLDVGSNSVKLQIADGRSGAPPLETSVFKDTVRLAERETDDGVIDQAGVERLVDVVRRAVRVSDRENAAELIGVRDRGDPRRPQRAGRVRRSRRLAQRSMRPLDVDRVEICPWALREGILLRRLDQLHDPLQRHEETIVETATLVPRR